MKQPFTTFFALTLAVCLSLYGPNAMIRADGVTFTQEIYADGVLATTDIDTGDAPVSVILPDISKDGSFAHDHALINHTILPSPRVLELATLRNHTRGDERPLSKDAYA